MRTESRVCRVRMRQDLYDGIKEVSDEIGASVSEVIKQACRKYKDNIASIGRVKKILKDMKYSDLKLYELSRRGEFYLYIHKYAKDDLNWFGEKATKEALDYLENNLINRTLMDKGIIQSDDGSNIILFRVNLLKIYCTYAPYQLIIISVEK